MLSLAELPTLRRAMRQQRVALDAGTQLQHAQAAAAHFSTEFANHLPPDSALKIALYSARGGEIDPAPLQQLAELSESKFYLPILCGQSLRFGEINSLPARKNRFGIDEPNVAEDSRLTADELDIIIVPLLAIDNSGNRLGMGGGFYDRTLTHVKPGSEISKPLLLGYAHDFQRVAALPTQVWDVPLQGIVTERLARRF